LKEKSDEDQLGRLMKGEACFLQITSARPRAVRASDFWKKIVKTKLPDRMMKRLLNSYITKYRGSLVSRLSQFLADHVGLVDVNGVQMTYFSENFSPAHDLLIVFSFIARLIFSLLSKRAPH